MPGAIITRLWSLGLESLSCDVDDAQVDMLKQYVELLMRWNKTYNLTAIRNERDIIPLHIFDSLVVADLIKGDNCLDVGSGAGLPSIPLAIIQPERQFIALDTNGKKTRFIQHAIIELGLKNVAVEQTRVESWQSPIKFDAIISRAFSSVHDFVISCSQHLADEEGRLYAMKGQFPTAEMQYLPKDFLLHKTHKLDVPFVDGERHLLEFAKKEVS